MAFEFGIVFLGEHSTMAHSQEAVLRNPLTERELEVLRLLAQGLTNREIAEALLLSVETIKWYNRQIYAKLDASNRTHAVAQAKALGVLDEQAAAAGTVPAPKPHKLPVQLSSFVGRQQEIAAVRRLLARHRLVTLTGPGGVGKTRLGLEAAAAVADHYADGVFFVSLLTADDAPQVPKALAQALGIVEHPAEPLSTTLQRSLEQKEMLLLLDNFEHVLAAVPVVTALLRSAPRLSLLVTSREALRLTGEYSYLVPPLSVPEAARVHAAADLSGAESATLFVQRARAASATFDLTDDNAAAVAEICRRLDGLPLAIELAAARTTLFSPQQLLNGLHDRLGILVGGPRDLPDRQRTLRATIDWSYSLLAETEKSLFARLAVFTNGRSLEAIEPVCGFGEVKDPLKALDSLLAKSLLYQKEGPAGEPRFYMLETIHEYARERLAASKAERQLRDRHLNFFLAWAEHMEPGYRQTGQFRRMAQTEAEWGNIRAAFNHGLERGNIEAAARLMTALNYFLRYTSRVVEGHHMMESLHGHLERLPTRQQIRFTLAAEQLAYNNGEIEKSARYAEQALALASRQGDEELLAWALHAKTAATLADREQAARFGHESLRLFRQLELKAGLAEILNSLGIIGKLHGDLLEAEAALDEALSIAQETGDVIRETMIRGNMVGVAYAQGEYEKAADLAMVNTKRRLAAEWWEWLGIGLLELAGPLAKLGQAAKAARLMGASATVLAGIGIDYQSTQQFESRAFVDEARSQLGEAAFSAAWAEGEAMTLREAAAYALEQDS